MLGTASVARFAAAGSTPVPSFRPSERSERDPESIITSLSSERMRKVNPTGVLGLDQVELPASVPLFQLLFSRNCRCRVIEDFEVYELVDVAEKPSTSLSLCSCTRLRMSLVTPM
jgi:hypothetical protein